MSKDNKELKFNIGKLCKDFRNKENYTLQNISDESGYSVQVLSAFEHGKSSNMFILITYFNMLSYDNKVLFSHKLFLIFNNYGD